MKTQVTIFAAILSIVAGAAAANSDQLAMQLNVEPGAYTTQELALIWADSEEERDGNRAQVLKRIEARRAATGYVIPNVVTRANSTGFLGGSHSDN